MSKALQVIKTEALTLEDKRTLDSVIEHKIKSLQGNRQQINRLVFESVAAMTEADDAHIELKSKGFFKRLWGGISGDNQRLQNKINENRSAAQYAAQVTLQKLAEQNLMTFDLITAVNNKLNISMLKVDEEIKNIYEGIKKFIDYNRGEMTKLNSRLDRNERDIAFLRWKGSIKFQSFNGIKYKDLDQIAKIVCLTRDFFDYTSGNWDTQDLLLLQDAMTEVKIDLEDEINYFGSLKEISDNVMLKEKLLGGLKFPLAYEPNYLITMSTLKKLESYHSDEKSTVDTIIDVLEDNGIKKDSDDICSSLTKKCLINDAFVDIDNRILTYDFVLDLLVNLKRINEGEFIDNNVNDYKADVEKTDIQEQDELYPTINDFGEIKSIKVKSPDGESRFKG